MTLRAQMQFWVVALALLIGGLWLFSEILLPFLAGLVLAYFLDPVADALERLGLPRLAATLIIVLASVVALAVALVVFLPMLGEQITKLAATLPHYVSELVAHLTSWPRIGSRACSRNPTLKWVRRSGTSPENSRAGLPR